MPKSADSLWKSSDSNCRPLSVVTRSGTPNFATHPARNVLAVVCAIISGIGSASNHRENLSIQVNR